MQTLLSTLQLQLALNTVNCYLSDTVIHSYSRLCIYVILCKHFTHTFLNMPGWYMPFSGYSSFGATPLKKDCTGLEKNNCTSPCPAGGKETCSVFVQSHYSKLAEVHKTLHDFCQQIHT